MNRINKIEDIYPLTIVAMRHGKYAIIEIESNSSCVDSLQNNEEWQYDPEYYMKKEWEDINYGIGIDIKAAFLDFKERYR